MSRSFGNTHPLTLQSSSSTSSRMSTAPGTDWEDLRKQARQHENEIDTKLMSFSKLCSNYVAHDQNDTTSATTTTPTSSFETVSNEIEKLLDRLSDINKRMSDIVPSLLGPNSAATHTLQRHHEILQDYRREFERTKTNIRSYKSREDLLLNDSTNKSDITTAGLSSRRQDYYLREMGHLNSSHKLLDTNIEMASMIKKDLSDQRRMFLNITTKINSIANRFPLVNNLLQKIKLKKRKDSLVLGFVIAICLIILLLYMFR
jgi:Golgi SNAP receptor complex protein 1